MKANWRAEPTPEEASEHGARWLTRDPFGDVREAEFYDGKWHWSGGWEVDEDELEWLEWAKCDDRLQFTEPQP